MEETYESISLKYSFKKYCKNNRLNQQLNHPQAHSIMLTPNQIESIQREAFDAGVEAANELRKFPR